MYQDASCHSCSISKPSQRVYRDPSYHLRSILKMYRIARATNGSVDVTSGARTIGECTEVSLSALPTVDSEHSFWSFNQSSSDRHLAFRGMPVLAPIFSIPSTLISMSLRFFGKGVIDCPRLGRLYDRSWSLQWCWVQESKRDAEIQVSSVRNRVGRPSGNRFRYFTRILPHVYTKTLYTSDPSGSAPGRILGLLQQRLQRLRRRALLLQSGMSRRFDWKLEASHNTNERGCRA